VGLIDALLDLLIAEIAVDTQRIYATGMSNGGSMGYGVACKLSERIAAIAPVSASMTIAVCQPTRSVPVIGLHSYQDTSVPYLGGIGDGVSGHYNSPQDPLQTAFALHANCAVLRDTLQHDAALTVVRWHECDRQQEMLLYMTQGGGHSWPGGTGSDIGDPPSTTISANDLMWDFFQQHNLGMWYQHRRSPTCRTKRITRVPESFQRTYHRVRERTDPPCRDRPCWPRSLDHGLFTPLCVTVRSGRVGTGTLYTSGPLAGWACRGHTDRALLSTNDAL